MSFNYSVQLTDQANAGGGSDSILVYDMEQALGYWSRFISGLGTLVVDLVINNTTEGREAGGPTTDVSVSPGVYEASSQYELTTGQHVSGTTSDITVTIDPGYFQFLDLVPNLLYDSQVPNNLYNPIAVFLHEIMHGFGMTGFYDANGNLPSGVESTFDTFIQKTSSGAYFTGSHAEAVYGGPVPLTANSTAGENYYHFGNDQADLSRAPSSVGDPLTLDLMNGIVLYFNYGYLPSNLDLAVLKDLGYNVTTPTPIAKLDFSGDGHSDILFHDSGGNTAFFDVRAGGASVAVSLGNVDPSWQIQDTGKYGDGSNEDILWRNSSTGQLISWSLTGDQKAAGYTDLGTVSSVWAIQTHNSSSDFFQDGADDILWRNSSTEQLVVWNMKAGKASNVVDLGTGPSADWKLVATADFTGDGSADILWRNSVSGQNFLWKWDGGSTGSTDVGTVATEWSIAGTGDFTGDGASDLLWYDNLTHQAVYWNLKDGGGHSGYTDLGTIPTGWQLQNPRDVTGDGTADLLVQNTSNGTIGYWPMDPGVSHALHTIATVSPGWHIT